MASSGGLSILEESSESGVLRLPQSQSAGSDTGSTKEGKYMADTVLVNKGELFKPTIVDVFAHGIRQRSERIRNDALEILGGEHTVYLMFDGGVIPVDETVDHSSIDFLSPSVQMQIYAHNRERILYDQGENGLSIEQFMAFLRDPRCGLDEQGQSRIRFQLFEPLGSGNFSRVYRAYDGLKDQQVTLKVMVFKDPQDDRNEALQVQVVRMIYEAYALQQVQHPHAARLHDDFACITADGGVLAMDGNYGPSLSRLLKREYRFSEQEVLHICGVLSGVLRHLHQKGVVHRDVKPSNVLRDFETGHLTLVDFGTIIGPRDQEHIPHHSAFHEMSLGYQSSTQYFSGTPFYMSPESLYGDPTDMNTPARDMYALGVTAYQLIEGHLPFRFGRMNELLIAVSNMPPPPFQREDMSPAVKAFVMQLLEKKPAARPTAEEAQLFFTRRRLANALHQQVPKGCFPESLAKMIHAFLPQRWLDALV